MKKGDTADREDSENEKPEIEKSVALERKSDEHEGFYLVSNEKEGIESDKRREYPIDTMFGTLEKGLHSGLPRYYS